MWAGCSVYITEDISDGHILFIQSQDDINGLKNAICIDKENNRFFVNGTSDSIIAFDVPVNYHASEDCVASRARISLDKTSSSV